MPQCCYDVVMIPANLTLSADFENVKEIPLTVISCEQKGILC